MNYPLSLSKINDKLESCANGERGPFIVISLPFVMMFDIQECKRGEELNPQGPYSQSLQYHLCLLCLLYVMRVQNSNVRANFV